MQQKGWESYKDFDGWLWYWCERLRSYSYYLPQLGHTGMAVEVFSTMTTTHVVSCVPTQMPGECIPFSPRETRCQHGEKFHWPEAPDLFELPELMGYENKVKKDKIDPMVRSMNDRLFWRGVDPGQRGRLSSEWPEHKQTMYIKNQCGAMKFAWITKRSGKMILFAQRCSGCSKCCVIEIQQGLSLEEKNGLLEKWLTFLGIQ